jgi:hypothetical protein
MRRALTIPIAAALAAKPHRAAIRTATRAIAATAASLAAAEPGTLTTTKPRSTQPRHPLATAPPRPTLIRATTATTTTQKDAPCPGHSLS